MNGEEKRRSPRIVYEDGCYVGYSEEKGLHDVIQRTKDLSESGIAIEISTPAIWTPKSLSNWEISILPSNSKGTVRRCDPTSDNEEMYLLGVEFVDVSDEEMEILQSILEANQ